MGAAVRCVRLWLDAPYGLFTARRTAPELAPTAHPDYLIRRRAACNKNKRGERRMTVRSSRLSAPQAFLAPIIEDADCQVQKPDEQILYRVEQDWRLDLWWSHDRYVNGEHVLHEEGSSFETGTLEHGTVAMPTQGEAEASSGLAGVVPAWQQFGFASPLGGVRGMGSVFQFSERDNRDLINFAVHVALQRGDRIRTVVFPMHVVLEALATRQLLAQMGYRFSLGKALEGMRPVGGDGGDSTQEMDAPEESILDEIDEEIVIN